MTRRCDICGRGPKAMIKRTYSHKAIKTWQALNLRRIKLNKKRVRICMKCYKKLVKEGRI